MVSEGAPLTLCEPCREGFLSQARREHDAQSILDRNCGSANGRGKAAAALRSASSVCRKITAASVRLSQKPGTFGRRGHTMAGWMLAVGAAVVRHQLWIGRNLEAVMQDTLHLSRGQSPAGAR